MPVSLCREDFKRIIFNLQQINGEIKWHFKLNVIFGCCWQTNSMETAHCYPIANADTRVHSKIKCHQCKPTKQREKIHNQKNNKIIWCDLVENEQKKIKSDIRHTLSTTKHTKNWHFKQDHYQSKHPSLTNRFRPCYYFYRTRTHKHNKYTSRLPLSIRTRFHFMLLLCLYVRFVIFISDLPKHRYVAVGFSTFAQLLRILKDWKPLNEFVKLEKENMQS